MANSNPNVATRFGAGNISGRPKGSRNKLGSQFVENLAADFDEHGAGVIQRVRVEQPHVYFTTIAKLLPKELAVAMQTTTAGPTAEHWPMLREIIDAIEVAGLANRQPGDVFELILHALRRETATLIEHKPAVALPPPPYGKAETSSASVT